MVMWVRSAAAALLVAAAVVGGASPAAAHGVGGVAPTNYETRVLSVAPALSDVTVRAVDVGSRLEIRNSSRRTVVVFGYDDEPYLRIGPRGVFENQRSPAVYLNRSLTPTGSPPPRFDSKAPPEWQRISTGAVARWHDHRAHWMGSTDPPMVRRARGEVHTIQRFVVPLEVGDTRVLVRGDVRWVPAPAPWPWLIGALLLAVTVIAASRTRWWAWVLGSVTALLAVLEVAHVVGLLGATSSSTASALWASGFSLAGVLLAVIAVAWLVRRGAFAAVPLVLVAAMVIGLVGGVADVSVLWNSQIPTTLAPSVARALVAATLGLGVGVFVGAALRLRPPRPVTTVRGAALPAG